MLGGWCSRYSCGCCAATRSARLSGSRAGTLGFSSRLCKRMVLVMEVSRRSPSWRAPAARCSASARATARHGGRHEGCRCQAALCSCTAPRRHPNGCVPALRNGVCRGGAESSCSGFRVHMEALADVRAATSDEGLHAALRRVLAVAGHAGKPDLMARVDLEGHHTELVGGAEVVEKYLELKSLEPATKQPSAGGASRRRLAWPWPWRSWGAEQVKLAVEQDEVERNVSGEK
ncbi:hypothetical protein BS78_01G156500 [Paspalum vaginatum]|nr:hypothetical protein BS78_01G156500 [Paspalum vaginatum]